MDIRKYPGPFSDVEIDFETLTMKNITRCMGESDKTKAIIPLTEEKLDWFHSEFIHWDFVNWIEEYY